MLKFDPRLLFRAITALLRNQYTFYKQRNEERSKNILGFRTKKVKNITTFFDSRCYYNEKACTLAIRTTVGSVRHTTFGPFRKVTNSDPYCSQMAFLDPVRTGTDDLLVRTKVIRASVNSTSEVYL